MRRTTAITVASVTAVALTVSACGREAADGSSAETGKAVAPGRPPAPSPCGPWAPRARSCPSSPRSSRPPTPASRSRSPRSRGTPRTTSSRPRSPPTRPPTSPWSAPPGWASSPGWTRSTRRPGEIDKSVFFEGAQKTTEVDGTSYGIPWYVETRLVFYRTDLAKKAGITSPPTDWDGLKAMAKAMQDKAGAKWGIGLQAGGTGSWQSVMPFAWSAGADLTKDGGKAYNFDSPEMLKAAKYYQSFFTDGISDKAAPATPTTEPDFASGKVPMFISGPWMMSAVEKVGGGAAFKDKYDVMQIPAGQDVVVLRRRLQPRRLQEQPEPRHVLEVRPVARRPQGPGQVVPDVDRPALGQERVAGPGPHRGHEARRLRQAARDRPGPAVVRDVGAGRRPRSTPRWRRSPRPAPTPRLP